MNTALYLNNYDKQRKIVTGAIILVLIILLMSSIYIVASELGGYVSEKLIDMSGVSNSQLVIDRSNISNSSLDIEMSSTEGTPTTHMNPTDSAYQLALLLPLIAITIIALFAIGGFVTAGTIGGIVGLMIGIVISLTFMSPIQAALTALLQ